MPGLPSDLMECHEMTHAWVKVSLWNERPVGIIDWWNQNMNIFNSKFGALCSVGFHFSDLPRIPLYEVLLKEHGRLQHVVT